MSLDGHNCPMAFVEMPISHWHDVPLELSHEWRGIFDRSSDGLDVSEACPNCGEPELHRWFQLQERRDTDHEGRRWQGVGGQWQWCSSCWVFEHTRSLVPSWWKDPLEVNVAELTNQPTAIEDARTRVGRSHGE